jgi:MFS family permease
MIEKIDGKEEIKKNKKLLRDAIINLISMRIYMFGITTFMILGNLITYLLSYLRGLQGEKKTITLPYSYLFSIVAIFFGVVQIIAPAIQNKLGLRCSVILGTFIILFSISVIYFSRLFILDILGYFILTLGSFCLPLLDRNFLYYFYEIRGKLIGALSLVSALESAGLNMFAEKFIVNPQSDEADVDELYYPFNISENIRKYIIFVIIIFSICAVISIIFIIPFDKNIHGKGLFHTALKGKDNSEEEENNDNNEDEDDGNKIELSFYFFINKHYKFR